MRPPQRPAPQVGHCCIWRARMRANPAARRTSWSAAGRC